MAQHLQGRPTRRRSRPGLRPGSRPRRKRLDERQIALLLAFVGLVLVVVVAAVLLPSASQQRKDNVEDRLENNTYISSCDLMFPDDPSAAQDCLDNSP